MFSTKRQRPRPHGIFFGTKVEDAKGLYFGLDQLETGLHILGPTGCGKSRLLLHLFKVLTAVPRATVVLVSPKGTLGRMARDFCIGSGLTSRLAVFDPGDSDLAPAFNPCRRNGLPIATQSKAIREAILAGHGQVDLDHTQQLARYALLGIYATLERGGTLLDAANILRAGSQLRRIALPTLIDPVVREAFEHFDRLPPARQDQLAASTLARLEGPLADPLMRGILTTAGGLDTEDVIQNHRILVADVRQYDPLRPSDVKFLLRLFVNDLIAHTFARPLPARSQPDPVYLLIDEVELAATEDLCRAFDQGREVGLRTIVAHQHLQQLELEDGNPRLKASVQNDARTKVVFGGLPVRDVEEFIADLYLDQWDPKSVKDEIVGLESIYRETTRRSETVTKTRAKYAGMAWPSSESRGRGLTRTHLETSGLATGSADGSNTNAGATDAMVMLPDGTAIPSQSAFKGQGANHVDTVSEINTTADGTSRSWQLVRSKGRIPSVGITDAEAKSLSTLPFYEIHQRAVVTNRTFWTRDEFLTMRVIDVCGLPQAYCVLKGPGKAAVTLRLPVVPEPDVGRETIGRAKERMRRLPYYRTPGEEAASPPVPPGHDWPPDDVDEE